MELVVLTQPTCAPCRVLKNYLTMEGVSFKEVNVQEEPDYIEQYEIYSTPVTLLLDSNGEAIEKVDGFSPDGIASLINKMN